MRDPKRIDVICKMIADLWHYYPDLRFFQLVSYIQTQIDSSSKDFFYFEDDKLKEELTKIFRQRGINVQNLFKDR